VTLEEALGNTGIRFWTCHCVENATIKWYGNTDTAEEGLHLRQEIR